MKRPLLLLLLVCLVSVGAFAQLSNFNIVTNGNQTANFPEGGMITTDREIYIADQSITSINGVSITSGVARYDFATSTWSAVGNGVIAAQGAFPQKVTAIGERGEDLIIATSSENFTDPSAIDPRDILLYKYVRSTGTTTLMVSEISINLADAAVNTILGTDSVIYLGGKFNVGSAGQIRNLSRYIEGQTAQLELPFPTSAIQQLKAYNGEIYVAGNFTKIVTQSLLLGQPTGFDPTPPVIQPEISINSNGLIKWLGEIGTSVSNWTDVGPDKATAGITNVSDFDFDNTGNIYTISNTGKILNAPTTNTGSWTEVATDLGAAPNDFFVLPNNNIVAVGSFSLGGNNENAALYNGTSWTAYTGARIASQFNAVQVINGEIWLSGSNGSTANTATEHMTRLTYEADLRVSNNTTRPDQIPGVSNTSASMTMTGSNLTADVVVTGSSDVEVSMDNSSFSPSLTLTQSGGSVSQTIYVRFINGAAGGFKQESIQLSSAGKTDVFFPIVGNIGKVQLTVTADDKSVDFNQPIPALTLSYSGFINGDDASVLTAQPIVSTTATAGNDAGTYTITVSGGSDDTYNLTRVNGTLTINRLDQTITWTQDLSSRTFNDGAGPLLLTATSTSGEAVQYNKSDPANVIGLSGNSITIQKAGSAQVNAFVNFSTNYNAAPTIARTVTINKADQTVSLATTPTVATFGDAPLKLQPTGGLTNNEVTFISSDLGVITTNNDSTLTFVGAGSSTITFGQAGNDNFNAAPDQTFDVTVSKFQQSVSYPSPPSAFTFGDTPVTLTGVGSQAGSTPANALVYTSSDLTVATTSGNTLTIVGAGTAEITLEQPGDANRLAATPFKWNITVAKRNQVVTLDPIATPISSLQQFINLGSNVVAPNSGNAVTYTSSNTAVANISGSQAIVFGTGSTDITAHVAGDANHNPGQSAAQTIVVQDVPRASQMITFPPLTAVTAGDPDVTLGATASTGNPVYYQSSDTTVAKIVGDKAQILKQGTTTIRAITDITASHFAATATQTLTVNGQSQNFSFNSFTTPLKWGDPDFTLTAMTDSGLPITYESSNTDVASVVVSGTTATVNINGVGTTIITANQEGSGTVAAATQSRTLVVNKADQLISFTNPGTTATYADTLVLGATNSSGIPVTYSVNDAAKATIDGDRMIITSGTGSVTVTASQAGNTYFSAAADVAYTLNLSKMSQTIVAYNPGVPFNQCVNFDDYIGVTPGSSSYTVNISGGSRFTCGGNSWRNSFNGAGFAMITARATDDNFSAHNQNFGGGNVGVTATVSISNFTQTLTYSPGLTFAVTGTANSGDATFTSSYAPVATVGNGVNSETVTVHKAGSTSIVAVAPWANGFFRNYALRTLIIERADQTINFAAIADQNLGASDITLAASAHATGPAGTYATSLPIQYTTSDPNVATISGSTLSIKGLGTVTITATQDGNGNYKSASLARTFNVVGTMAQDQTVDLTRTDVLKNGSTITLPKSTEQGLNLTYSVTSGPGSIVNGNQLQLTGVGTVAVQATHAGNFRYKSFSTSQDYTVNGVPSVSLSAPKDHLYSATAPIITNSGTDGSGAAAFPTLAFFDDQFTALGSSVPVNVGTYFVNASITDGPVTTTMGDTLIIRKDTVRVTFPTLSRDYNTANPAFNFSYSGFKGSDNASGLDTPPVAVTAATQTSDAGTYPIFSNVAPVDNNYVISTTFGVLTVNKISGVVNVTDAVIIHDGNPKTLVSSTVPASLATTISYEGISGTTYGPIATAPSAIGTYQVTVTINDTNYQGSSTGNLTITDKFPVTINVNETAPISFGFDGNPHGVTIASIETSPGTPATPTPAVNISYQGINGTTYASSATAPTNAGQYQVTLEVDPANATFAGLQTVDFTITNAAATVALNNLTQVYTGSALSPGITVESSPGVTITPTPALTYNYVGINGTTYGPATAAPTNAGEYTVTATIDVTQSNYNGNASGTLTIQKAAQNIVFNAIPNVACGQITIDLSQFASVASGLPISYSGFDTNIITITGNIATIVGTGTTTITAAQVGDANHLAAAVNPQQAITVDVTQTNFTVDAPANVAVCNGSAYTLPALTNGNYYTGQGGTGTQLSAGHSVTSTTTLYVYGVSSTNSACTDENSFTINIQTIPVDSSPNISSISSYTLPTLTNGSYYSATGGPNGSGSLISPGAVINSGTQTIYIYAEDPANATCFNETSFTVTVAPISDQTASVLPTSITCVADAVVSLTSSQNGANYNLFDNTTHALVQSGLAGNSGNISFSADNTTATRTYGVYATDRHFPTSLQFDNFDGFATIPNTINTSINNNITLETWAYIPSGNSPTGDDQDDHSTIISSSLDPANLKVRFSIHLISGVLNAGFFDGSAWHRVVNVAYPRDQWFHLAATYDQQNIRVYINGDNTPAHWTQANTNPLPVDNTVDWYLGRRWDGVVPNDKLVFGGQLAETRIWSVARSQAEIQANKDVTLSGAQTGLVVNYDYKDGPGTTITDRSGNGLNATIQNMPGDATTWKPIGLKMSATPTVTVNSSVSDQTVEIVQPTVQSATVSMTGSETGVDYYLRDNANNSVLQGPLAGTGSAISFATDQLSAARTYNVFGAAKGTKPIRTMKFDDVDDHIVLPTALTNEFATNQITVETWANIPATETGTNNLTALFAQEIIASQIMFAVYIWQGEMYAGFFNSGWTDIQNISYPTDQWTHVAATYDQTHLILYINGVEVGRTAATAALPPGTGEWRIGRRWDGAAAPDQIFGGSLAETRVWNVARTQTQIVANMNSPVIAAQPGLVLNYNYGAGSGTTVTNVAGNTAYNGVMTNMAGDATNWIDALTTASACILQMTNTPAATYSPQVTIANTDIDFTAPASLVYDGNEKIYAAAGIASLNPALPGTELDLTYEGRNSTTYASSMTAPTNAGDYTVTATVKATNANYTGSATFDFSIAQADLTVTADAGQTKVYGAADPANYTYSLTAGTLFGADALSGNASRNVGENVGTYSITQGTVTAGANYNINFVSNDFDISRAVITVAPQDATITYGVTGIDNNMYPYVATGFQFSDDETVLNVVIANASVNIVNAASPGNALNAGIHTGALEWNGRPVILDNSGNYVVQMSGVGDVTVNAAQVGVTAEAKSKDYDGDAGTDPALTYTVDRSLLPTTNAITYPDPFVFTGTLSRATGQDAGTYGITQGDLSLGGNYAINYTGADFTVNQATLEATADFKSMQYAAASMPGLTISYTGFVNGEDESVIDAAPMASTSATLSSNAGDYPITLTGGSDNNYLINLNNGTFRIEQRILTVAVQNESRLYGSANPTFTLVPTGFVNGETVANLNNFGNLFADASAVTNTSDVGNYSIPVQASGTTLETNYNISLSSGILTVNPLPLTITPDAGQSKAYGQTDPVLTFTSNPASLVGSDGFSGALSRVDAGGGLDAPGTYNITTGNLQAGGNGGNNYSVSLDMETFEITRAATSINLVTTPNPVYSGVGQGATATANDINGNPTLSLLIEYRVQGSANPFSTTLPIDAGSYDVRANLAASETNYSASEVTGTFTIDKAPLTATLDPATVPYGTIGANNQPVTFTGFVNGETDAVVTIGSGHPTVNFINLSGGSTHFAAGATYPGEIKWGATAANNITASNYDINFVNGDLTVSARPINITADNRAITYGADANSGNTVTFEATNAGSRSGLANGETVADFTGTLGFANITQTAVGMHAGVIIPSGYVNSNYDITYVNGDLTINKAQLTVKAQNISRNYGAVNPTVTVFEYSGFTVPGDGLDGSTDITGLSGLSGSASGTIAATATAMANAGTTHAITVDVAALNSANYDFVADNSGMLTITTRGVTVTVDAGQTKVYGQSDPASFTYTPTPALETGDSFTGALTRVAGENVNTYAIQQGTLSAGSNYSITFNGDDFSITPRGVTVTVDAGQTKVYGQSDPAGFTYTPTPALETGDSFTGALTRVAGENVSTYAIQQGTLTAGSNYSITFNGDDFSITPRGVTVAVDASQTKVYGQSDPASFTYTPTPALETGDSFTGALTRVAGENVNTYAIQQGTLTAGSNYSITFNGDDFSITPRGVTVTVDAGQTKVYGQPDPASFTYTPTPALETGDSFTGALTRVAGENVSTYAIQQGTLSAGSNYSITFNGDDFSITPRGVTVTVDAGQTKVYGQSDPASFTYTPTPALETGDSFTGALTRVAGENVNTYAIQQGTLSGGSNYSITFNGDDFSITPRGVTVTVDAGQTKVYGQTDPASFTYTPTPALETGDSFTGALTRVAGENVNTYAIQQGTLTAGSNYSITFNGDDFSITPRGVTVTVDAGQTKVYGQSDPANFTYTPTPELETGDSFTGALTRVAGENVNTYAIQQGTLSGGSNYSITFNGDDFSITPRGVTVTVDAGQTKVYGQSDPASFTYSPTPALETGDTFTGALTRVAGENVSTYAIQQGTLAAGSNYSITFNGDDFSITPRDVTVTVDAGQTKVYGQTDPASFTYTPTPALETGDSFTGALTRVAGENVSTYTIQQGTLSAGSNYSITFNGDDFSITPRGVTVTVDAGQTKVYGQTDPASFTYTPTPALETGDNFTGALTRVAGENVSTYAIQQGTLSAGSNYSITFNGDDFAITQSGVSVIVDAGQSKVYGQPDPASYTYTFVPALETGDSFTGALTRAVGEGANVYAIQQGTLSAGNNYAVNFISSNFEISTRPISITADDQSKTVGQADPALTYTITSGALQFSDVVSGTLERTAGETANTYAINQGTLDVGSNYDLTYVPGTFTITNKLTQTITFNPLTDVSYGDTDFNLSATGGASGNPLTFASTNTAVATVSGNTVTIVGVGTTTITASQVGDATYADASDVNQTLTVLPRALTVTADATDKIYGDADPMLTFQVTSGTLVSGDMLTGALNRVTGEAVNTYAIQQGTLANSNYTITYIGADLTINKRAITVSADDQSKTYGDADPALTHQITSGALQFTDVFSGSLARAAGEAAGAYAINQGSLSAGNNYDLTYVAGNMQIGFRTIQFVPGPISKTYGDTDPALEVPYTSISIGSLAFDDVVTITGNFRDAGENVGSYQIRSLNANFTSTNGASYAVSFMNAPSARLIVNQRAITVTADAQSKTYGGPDPQLTHQVTLGALQFTDALTGALDRIAGENVGTYSINQGTLSAGSNYTLTYVGDDLTIDPIALAITADDKTKVQGTGDPSLTYTRTSGTLINGDILTGALTRVAGETLGDYAIQQGSLTAGSNYSISFTDGTLTITNKLLQSITFNALSNVTYGDADFTINAMGGMSGNPVTFSGDNSAVATVTSNGDVTIVGVGTVNITANQVGNATYADADPVVQTLTVNPAALTITADNQSATYGDAGLPALSVSYSGFVNSETASVLSSTPVTSTTAMASSDAGDYPITVSGAAADNYSITHVDGTMTIDPATLTVTADDKSTTYGDAIPTLTLAYAGFVNSEDETVLSTLPSSSTVATNTSSAGTYAITVSGATATNYTITEVDGTLTVNQATLSVTADDQSKTYGDANPTLTVSYSGFVNGDNASVLDTSPSGSTTATSASSVGTYSITASGGVDNNYTFSYTDGTLTVNQAALSVTADDQSKNYGDANPTLSLTYSGFVNGDDETSLTTVPTITTTATSTSSVGTYAITAAGGSDANYTFSYTDGILTVNQATLTVSVDDQVKTYSEANPTLTLTYAGFQNGEDETVLTTAPTASTTATSTSSVGTYAITAADGSDANYSFSYTDGTLTVNQATLSVTADDQSKTYGEANPTLTVSYSGFVNGDDETSLTTAPTASTTADATSSVGTYAITASGGVADNYTFSYTDGTLTINQATLTVSVDDQSKTYGEANPTLSLTYTGFQNGDDETVLTTAPTVTTTATSTSSVGTYAITASGGVADNYTFSYTDGTLTINQATLTVSVVDQSKTYGDANPTLSLTYTGFQNGDDETVLTTAPTVTTTATSTSSVGTYAITASGGVADNYTLNYSDGTLTVNQATLSVSADDQSKTYGDANPALTLAYAGFVGTDDETVLDTAPSAFTTATQTSDAGAYSITVSGGVATNYGFSYTDGTLTINKADQTITFDALTDKSVGDADFDLTATASSGLTITYTSSDETVATISGATVTILAAGTTTITAAQSGGTNFNVATEVTQTLTVNNNIQSQTITFETLTNQTYGASPLELAAVASSGLVVSYASSDESVATINGSTVTILSVGTTTITASQGGNDSFTAAADVSQTLTIDPATLTATADDQMKVYGEANPTLSLTYTGFQNGEDATVLTTVPTVATIAEAGSDVGTYSIELAGGSAANYTITPVNGTLTITKANLTITADDQTMRTGDAVPTLTTTITGFVNGDVEADLNVLPAIATTVTSSSPSGLYDITLTGGEDNNYEFTLINGTLTVETVLGLVLEQTQIMIYPNPVVDKLYIDFPQSLSGEEITVQLFDMEGRKLQSQRVEGYGIELDVSQISTGMLILQMSAGGEVIRKRVKKD